MTSRSHPRSLGHKGSRGARGDVLVDHRRWDSPDVAADVEGIAGPGACLRIGQALIGVQDLRLRCIMTSYDPDTLVQDKAITRGIYQRFQGRLALNRFVVEVGEMAVGDDVQLVRGRACSESSALIE